MVEINTTVVSDFIRRLQSAPSEDNNTLASLYWEAKSLGIFPVVSIPDTKGDALLTVSDKLFLLKQSQNLPEGYAGNKPEVLFKLIPPEKAEPILLKAKAAAKNALGLTNSALTILHPKM